MQSPAKYDYSKLLGKMREKKLTQVDVCKMMKVSETTLNHSLGNKRPFKQTEISKMCEILDIPLGKIDEYFFSY